MSCLVLFLFFDTGRVVPVPFSFRSMGKNTREGLLPVVKRNQPPAVPRPRRRRRRYRLEEVGRPVRRNVRGGPHGARRDEGLGAVEGKVNTEGLRA